MKIPKRLHEKLKAYHECKRVFLQQQMRKFIQEDKPRQPKPEKEEEK